MAMTELRQTNLLALLPDARDAEQIEEIIQGRGCRIERIVSQGQASAEGFWYDQEQAEWVLVLRGQAVLEFAEPTERRGLGPGDSLLIPAHRRHRVAWTDPNQATIWLAVHLPA
jgi:cupin 2 domain-containing protein